MVSKPQQRRGRPAEYVRDQQGKPIVGLSLHKSSGRYYATHSKPRIYLGKDYPVALIEFREWEAKQTGAVVAFSVPLPPPPDPRPEFAPVDTAAPDDTGVEYTHRTHRIPRDVYIAQLRADLSDPATLKLLAEETGFPLDRLEKFAKSPRSMSLSDVGNLYFDRADQPAKDNNKTNNIKYWDEFRRVSGATNVADLDADAIGQYSDYIVRKWKGRPPANIRNRYGIVRRVLSYAIERGKESKRMPQVLVLCGTMLKPPKQSEPDPIPIETTDFTKLLSAADKKWTAILLLSLNLCMKPQAVVATLKIDADLKDGIFNNLRPKTKQKRVGILMQRTIDAIRDYQKSNPHKSDHLFVNGEGNPYPDGRKLTTEYRQLRKTATVATSVKFEHIRDGGYTYGDDGTDAIKLLAGHSTGIKGRYRKLLATKTAKVVGLIEKHYFAAKKITKTGKRK